MRVLALFLFALLLVGLSYSQRNFIRHVDSFDVGDMSIVIQLTGTITPSTNVSQTQFFSTANANSADILGGERDLQFVALTGTLNRVFSTSVQGGEWEVSTPAKCTSKVIMQYDGIDNSINLNPTGFTSITGASAGLDLTFGGTANGFDMVIETDLATDYVFTLYDIQGRTKTRTQNVASGSQNVTILFSNFQGSASLTAIGAIVVEIEGLDNVDTTTTLFDVTGPQPSRTATATRSPRNPSPSRSNSPESTPRSRTPSRSQPVAASNSRTPSHTPSPSALPTCQCVCPHFRCGVVYDVPNSDDDDNASSERIIYRPVFYYAANHDFDGIEGDDDGQSTWVAFSRKVAEFQYGYDDVAVYLYLSGANTITTSITLVIISLLALIF